MDLREKLIWTAVAVLGAVAFGVVALTRGEAVNAAWLVTAAVCIYFIAFRFYALFIVSRALGVDPKRVTPAYRHNDGLDYVPTNRYVLFGHHFAAIAGAGPLVGPVLAAQMGYLPGTLWILAGVVFAGAVQDMVVLFFSTRRDGRSLAEMIRTEIGPAAGGVVGVGIMLISVILLAVLALVVVNALKGSPWGTFAVASTIPIALFMGLYSRFVRPGRIGEMSAIGAVLLLIALVYGKTVAETPALAAAFTFTGAQLALLIIGYGFVASVLPVWLLLAPRDYLSTFLKVGTIVLLAIGILVVRPDLEMPAVTKFIDGSGPVWAGSLFPFLFITIACGAVSGWHSLISSGTTPKMIENENQIRFIGYGAMLMEVVRRHHGDGGGHDDPPGRLFRHEQRRGPDRDRSRPRRRGHHRLGFLGHAGHAHAGRPRRRRNPPSCRGPAERRRSRSAWRRSSRASSAARRWPASGTTSPSCSRRCSS